MLRLVFSAIAFLGLQGLLYYYLWRRLAVSTQLSPRWRRRIAWALGSLGVMTLSTLLISRFVSPAIGQTLGWPAFLWMAMLLLMATMFAATDVIRELIKGAGKLKPTPKEAAPPDPARRAFVGRVLGGGVVASTVSLTGAGTVSALKTPGVKDVEISLKNFPESLNEFAIVQLTDIHVGNTIGRGFIEDVVERANAARPDVIVITGDLVDGSVADLANAVAPLADLHAPHGVFFVTGNHEYYAGADAWIKHIESLGIRVLRNERVAIGNEEVSFDLVGVDDYNAGRWPGHGPDLAKAVAGRDTDRALVVLAHQPRQVHESVKHGVGLQLSGHTHGGQIWPWHYLAMAQQGGLLAGHSRHGDTQLYISRGTGYWGPPVRVFAPSEITRITLRRTQSRSA